MITKLGKLREYTIRRVRLSHSVLKIFLGMLVVAMFTFFGYLFSRKFRIRRKFFGQLRGFNEQFIHEITYYRRPIKEFLSKKTYEGEFQGLIVSYLRWVDATNQQAFDLSSYTFLQENEKMDIRDYFMSIGKGDSSSQKCYFLSMQERLKGYELDAALQGKKYESLYVELGFLCGLFILILII